MPSDQVALRRDGHRFLGADDADGKPSVRFVQWLETLYFSVERPGLRASAVTDGWVQAEVAGHNEDAKPQPVEPHQHYELALGGSLKLRPDQKLGFITENGVTLYSGDIELEVHVGLEEESHIHHFPKTPSENGQELSGKEIVFVSIYLDLARMEWFQNELRRRPRAEFGVAIKFKPYLRLDYNFDHRKLYIEPDNAIDKSKACPIVGASLILTESAASVASDGDDAEEDLSTPNLAEPQLIASRRAVRYLGWILALQVVLAVLILLKR